MTARHEYYVIWGLYYYQYKSELILLHDELFISWPYNSDPGPLSIYLAEDDLPTFELLVDFLYYHYHVTTVLTEIILERLPSQDESRIETLIKLYRMGCKY